MTIPKQPTIHRCESGIALVVTLSIVVLITFVCVAFFVSATATRSVENASAGGIQSRLLAEGVLAAIDGDLQAEAVAGSKPPPNGNPAILYPKNGQTMRPIRSLVSGIQPDDANFLNVIKQSGTPFFTSGTDLTGTPATFNFAAAQSSGAAGSNGRLITPNRWSAPQLTGREFASDQLPSWIYVTPTGYSATLTDDTIGRIAFNVYDIGGLLDANAVGFAPTQAGQDPEEFPTKGGLVWADLRALPGIKATAYRAEASWPPQWRVTGDWATFKTDDSAGTLSAYRRSGWLQPFIPSGGASADRMFTSRQDLIRYAETFPGTFTTGNSVLTALQYLTTFSRDVDRTTFATDPNRPKVAANSGAGGNDAKDADDLVNPALVAASDQSGNPRLAKRFPLSRLALVATPIPPASPPGDTAEIRKFFGLTWDSGNNQWIYNHDNPGINRLQDVPADREPDFFEILKAAISVGSLGKQFGAPYPASYTALAPSRLGGEDGSINNQIIQIGANIIDQADEDSYPTRIEWNGRTFYGIEDLPRLFRAHDSSYYMGVMPNFGYRTADAAPITKQAWLYVTLVSPELWNPHRPSPNATSARPQNFRIVAQSTTAVGVEAAQFWNATGGPVGFASNLSARPGGPDCSALLTYSAQGSSAPALTFNVGSGEADFREPRPLSAVGFPVGSNASGSVDAPDMTLTATSSPGQPDTVVRVVESVIPPPLNGNNPSAYRDALGFVVGYMPICNTGSFGQWLSILRGRGGPLNLELQFEAGDNWWTIDRLTPAWQAGEVRFFGNQGLIANRADPRSSRWGSLYAKIAGYGAGGPFINQPATPYRFQTGRTHNPQSNVQFGVIKDTGTAPNAPGWTFSTPSGEIPLGPLQSNSAGSSAGYTDPDGVLRLGDAGKADSLSSVGWPQHENNTDSRPVILNRPFRSVGELGYVFRDTPWRSLDFSSPSSGDRALLDVFTIDDQPADGIVAGRVNLNTRQVPVISALLRGASLASGAAISVGEAEAAASELTTWTTSTDADKGPLRDRSELVGRFVSGSTFAGPATLMADQIAAADRPIAASRNAVARSIIDAGTTRSWNFLVDVIAQSGRKTTGSPDFSIQGETRLWHSVAIDRFTGDIIDSTNETVVE